MTECAYVCVLRTGCPARSPHTYSPNTCAYCPDTLRCTHATQEHTIDYLDYDALDMTDRDVIESACTMCHQTDPDMTECVYGPICCRCDDAMNDRSNT